MPDAEPEQGQQWPPRQQQQGGTASPPQAASNDHLLPPPHSYGLAYDKKHMTNGNSAVHMPSSLFTNFPKLPPDGSTLTPEEARCNPEVERCHTPIHVWEARCTACGGSGTSRSYSSHSRHRLVAVCLLCHGLGYVRHSTTHTDTVPYVNGSGPNTTIGRPPPPEHKPHRFHWPGLHISNGNGTASSNGNGSPFSDHKQQP